MANSGNAASVLSEQSGFVNVLQLFDHNVRKYPNNTALTFDGKSLTYRELSLRIGGLTTALQERGVRNGEIVAISIERSIEMVISMLAVLKAGGAFIPVDPNYPVDRRRFMLLDSSPILILTSKAAAATLPNEVSGINKICLDGQFLSDLASSPAPTKLFGIDSKIDPEDRAYIIYTSGTTGKPKGAINTHKGLLNLTYEQIAAFGVTPDSRVLQFASFSFDASVSEIVMALGSGATLVMARQSDLTPGPTFVNLLINERVSHITLPPSVLGVLPELSFPDLKVIVVAGEACPLELARRWSKSRRFINAYGVSEAAVCSAIKDFDPALSSMPIGRAMGGTEFLVLDERMTQVQPGEVGELFIGGVGVGLGYLNRPELTAEKFVQFDSFGGRYTRYYRTGDLVKLLSDGSLDYIGRKDNQVKVRGFRIELDEIATAVQEYKPIQQCAVIVRPDASNSNQIVCYFRQEPNHTELIGGTTRALSGREVVNGLRSFLSAKLPSHMIPVHFIPIDTFPLSPSGKVDLKALRERKIEHGADLDAHRYAQSECEVRLSNLMGTVLELEQVPMELSFLDLGGDSLKAAELAWRIEESFSVSVLEVEILGAKSISEIAKLIESKSSTPPPKLEVVSRDGFFDPAPAQEIFGILESLNVDSSPLNCCAACEVSGSVDFEALSYGYRELFKRHESLRLKFAFLDGKFKMSAQPSVDAKIDFVDFSEASTQNEKLRKFFAEAERLRFSMSDKLLLRSFLIKLDSERSLFVLVTHHAIFDAWSLRVFMQDLFALTAEKVTGRKLVEPLRIQFLDYVVWLRKVLNQRDAAATDRYLKGVFAKPHTQFDLLEHAPRPAIKSRRGGNCFLKLTKGETSAFQSYCEKLQLTPFMACTAILNVALYKHTGQADITLGGPISIRNHRELERQIGIYSSVFILRTEMSDSEPFEKFLKRTQNGLLEAYKNQVFSIGELFGKYNLAQDLSRTPPYDISLASTMFDLALCDPEVEKALGIRITPYRFPLTTSFFDFEFTLNLFDGELELEIRYDSGLYREDQAKTIAHDFYTGLILASTRNAVTVGDATRLM